MNLSILSLHFAQVPCTSVLHMTITVKLCVCCLHTSKSTELRSFPFGLRKSIGSCNVHIIIVTNDIAFGLDFIGIVDVILDNTFDRHPVKFHPPNRVRHAVSLSMYWLAPKHIAQLLHNAFLSTHGLQRRQ